MFSSSDMSINPSSRVPLLETAASANITFENVETFNS
jgi:hypothetical protein